MMVSIQKMTAEEVSQGVDLTGKTVLLTGCSSGIGLETLRILALRGAKVLALARTLVKAKQACQSVNGLTQPYGCNLEKVSSIVKFIEKIDEPIDILIANAGVMALPDKTLVHGIEAHMFINHISHAIIIQGLQKHITKNARIIILTSAAHSFVKGKGLFLDDLQNDRPYKPMSAYAHSKLANMFYATELVAHLRKGQTVNSVHPGVIDTNLFRHMPGNAYPKKAIKNGAAGVIHLAISNEWAGVTGQYFSAGKIGKPSAIAQDKKQAKELWNVTQRIINDLTYTLLKS